MVTSSSLFRYLWIFLLGAVDLSGQSNATTAILAIEQTRFEAMIRRDTAALQQLLSDDLVYIHSNALKEDKTEHIRSIASEKIIYKNMDRETAQVRFYGKTSITNGTIKVKGLLSGNPFEVRMLYTAVYRKQHKNWQLVNWQSTRASSGR